MTKILSSATLGNKDNHIIILHGLFGEKYSWKKIAEILSEYFTIHLLDLRNHGESFHSSIFTLEEMAEDIKNYADYKELKKFFLIGHSLGGKVAMFFADKYPNYIKKLIIADISPRSYVSLQEPAPNINFLLNVVSQMLNLNLDSFNSYSEIRKELISKDQNSGTIDIILKNIKKIENKFYWKINLQTIANNIPEVMKGLDTEKYINNPILTPSTFIKCENSDFIKADDYKLIKFIFKNSEVIDLKSCSHFLNVDQPEAVAEIVIQEFKDSE